MTELCKGLDVLHRQEPPIIHNDIKTSNIMLQEDGGVKLFDFDISRVYKEGSYKNTKLMGTYEYAAPEHYGFGQSDPRTDIYSLGVTMHEMLTGVGLDHDHNVTYQGGLAKILRKCVEIDRKKRYASAALLKSDLEKYQKSRGRHVSKTIRLALKIILVCVCTLLLFAVGGLFLRDCVRWAQKSQGAAEVEGNYSEEDLETESKADTEENQNTEENSDSEENQNTEGIETTEDEETSENTEGSEIKEDSDVEENMNHNTDADTITSLQNNLKEVYESQGTILAMNMWTDGTVVLLEESSGNYYLKSLDGKENLLDGAKASSGAKLECNPYTNQMYLSLYYYGECSTYTVNRELEIVRLSEYADGTGELGFNTNTSINDKVYEFILDPNYDRVISAIVERDVLSQKVVNEWRMEKYIHFFAMDNDGAIYNNGQAIYFIAEKGWSTDLYRFDGVTFEKIACLNNDDFKEVEYKWYEYLCVTDTAIRFKAGSSVYEISLE